MTLHEIGELDRKGLILELSPKERSNLRAVDDRLGVEWREGESVRIYSRGWIGSVNLSDETSVRVVTKLPISNVLQLASLAYRILRIPPAFGNADLLSNEAVTDWLAVMLTAEIRALLQDGLRQDYVVIEDDLPYVRGRLRFEGTPFWSRPGLTACEFADFLPDIVENRIIRATLEVLATHSLLPGIRVQVEQLLRSFQMVSYVRPTRQLIEAYRETRLNLHYAPLIQLCRLFLEQAGVELEPGNVRAPAFFFPMEYVFQEAITALLGDRIPDVARQPSGSHSPAAGFPSRRISFSGDIAVGSPPMLILDTKYANAEEKNRYGGLSFRNEHIYQVAFYALSFGCPALLVYPEAESEIDVTFDVEGVRVGIVTVDLQQPELPGLETLIVRVMELVEDVSDSRVAVSVRTT